MTHGAVDTGAMSPRTSSNRVSSSFSSGVTCPCPNWTIPNFQFTLIILCRREGENTKVRANVNLLNDYCVCCHKFHKSSVRCTEMMKDKIESILLHFGPEWHSVTLLMIITVHGLLADRQTEKNSTRQPLVLTISNHDFRFSQVLLLFCFCSLFLGEVTMQWFMLVFCSISLCQGSNLSDVFISCMHSHDVAFLSSSKRPLGIFMHLWQCWLSKNWNLPVEQHWMEKPRKMWGCLLHPECTFSFQSNCWLNGCGA